MERLNRPLSVADPPCRFASALAASGALHVLTLLVVLFTGMRAPQPPPQAVFVSLGTMPAAPPQSEQIQDSAPAMPASETPERPRRPPLPGPLPGPPPSPPPSPPPGRLPVSPSRPSPAPRPAPPAPGSATESGAEYAVKSAADSSTESARQSSTSGPAPTAQASATGAAAGKSSLPYVTYSPTPLYPQEARLAGREGKVRLKVLIAESGRVIDVALLQSSGVTRLDETAVAALYTWRFHPAYRDEQAIPAWVIVPVVFALR